jgi:hypothetical protein
LARLGTGGARAANDTRAVRCVWARHARAGGARVETAAATGTRAGGTERRRLQAAHVSGQAQDWSGSRAGQERNVGDAEQVARACAR